MTRDVKDVTTPLDDVAAHLTTPVMWERETVMDVVMEDSMMGTGGARVTWSVAATTVQSLVCTTMRRMTVVKKLLVRR